MTTIEKTTHPSAPMHHSRRATLDPESARKTTKKITMPARAWSRTAPDTESRTFVFHRPDPSGSGTDARQKPASELRRRPPGPEPNCEVLPSPWAKVGKSAGGTQLSADSATATTVPTA